MGSIPVRVTIKLAPVFGRVFVFLCKQTSAVQFCCTALFTERVKKLLGTIDKNTQSCYNKSSIKQ